MSISLFAGGYNCVSLTDSNGVLKIFKMSRLLYTCFKGVIPKGMVIDHRDGNRLNDSLDNLRLCTKRENSNFDNIKRIRSKTSRYTGVSFHAISGKYRAAIKINGKSKYLGIFKYEYDAHLAYQQALSELVNS